MHKLTKEVRVARAKHASDAAIGSTRAAKTRAERVGTYGRNWDRMYYKMRSAKQRCENPASASYKNYGGRGVKFGFASVAEAALWVLDNLGGPEAGQSIDRIDNDRGYEPGNLRWATRVEQNRNKRAYMGAVYGKRIQQLRLLRPDMTYETIRTWVKKGLNNDEITTRRKHIGCGVRHS